jgi:hypothetical protein
MVDSAGTTGSSFLQLDAKHLSGEAGITNSHRSPDGKFIATGSEDGSLFLFDSTVGDLRCAIKGHGYARVISLLAPFPYLANFTLLDICWCSSGCGVLRAVRRC